jgi:predicted double-glycine peptidase
MQYFKQEKDYTCGVACFRMVMSAQGLPDVDEDTLETIMGTTWDSGTSYDKMVAAGKKFGLSCVHGQGVTLDFVDKLSKSGWTVVLAYSLDVPHYSVYTKLDSGQVFLCDPHLGEKVTFPIHKFERALWAVELSRYKCAIADFDLKFDLGDESKCWYVAYKKSEIEI